LNIALTLCGLLQFIHSFSPFVGIIRIRFQESRQKGASQLVYKLLRKLLTPRNFTTIRGPRHWQRQSLISSSGIVFASQDKFEGSLLKGGLLYRMNSFRGCLFASLAIEAIQATKK
jgi:hypothetical protein